MIELRKQVERIVRPLRASSHRKNRMREELLVHLGELYEQERAAHPDNESAALATALERFGDPAALRAELQATVPAVERGLTLPIPFLGPMKRFTRQPGETTLDFIRRTAVWATLINALVWLLFVLFCATFLRQARANDASSGGILTLIGVYVVMFPLLTYGPQLLCERTWFEWQKRVGAVGAARTRAMGRAAVFLSALLVVYGAFTALFLMLLSRAITYPLVNNFWFWTIVLIAGAAGLPFGLLQIRAVQSWERWDGLVIDESSRVPRAA